MQGTANKKNVHLENYKNTAALIDSNAEAQKRAAHTNYEKLLKYLPEYNAARGITGGASESAMLRAQSDYSSKIQKIDSEASALKAVAQEKYNDNLLKSYSENYGLAMDTISNWTGNADDLEKYVGGLGGSVSDEQYQSLLNAYGGVKDSVKEQDKQKAYMDKINDLSDLDITLKGVNKDFTRGDNFYITINNEKREVQLGEPVQNNSGAYYAALNSGISDGSIFMYDGELYYMNGDKIHRVEAKYTEKKSGKNQYIQVKNDINGARTPMGPKSKSESEV